MADLQGMLERQTSKVEELRQQAEQEPTVASLQALSSILRSRADTLAALGDDARALEDRETALGLLAQLVLGAGRDDLVEPLVETGEQVRATLRAQGRDDEAFDNALGETQLVAATGHVGRAVAQLRGLADERKASLAGGQTEQRIGQVVKALSVLGSTLLQAQRLPEALEVETETVDLLASLQPPQPELLAGARGNRALTRAAMGRTDEAFAELDEVIATFDQLLGASFSAQRLASAVEMRARRAQLLIQQQEKVDEGVQALEETAAYAERYLQAGDEDAATVHRRALRQLAETARLHGKYDQALPAAEKWVALLEARANGGAADLELVEELLEASYERALLLHLFGRYDVALEDATQMAATWGRLAEAQPERLDLLQRVLMALDLRERSLSALGRNEEAVQDQTAIIEGFQQLLRQGGPPQLFQAMLMTLQRRAETLRKLGRDREAQADLALLQRILRELQGGGQGPAPEPDKKPGGGGIIL